MSRRATITTDIEVKEKDREMLNQAIEQACQDIGGDLVSSIAYYTGDIIVGISKKLKTAPGYDASIEVGITIKNDKLTFVGEDFNVHSAFGKQVQDKVKMGYQAAALKKVFKRLDYSVSSKSLSQRNAIKIEAGR